MFSETKKSTIIITDIWNEHSGNLKTLAQKILVNENVVEHALKRKATENSYATSSTTLAIKKLLKKKKSAETTVGDDPGLIESDSVFVSGSDVSVGTAIKRAAYNLHENNRTMSCQERKIMTSGLSSILGLSDDSFDSQRSLFTQMQWNELHARYDPRLDTPLYELGSDITDNLKIACSTLEFLKKSQDQLTGVSNIALKIAEHVFGLTKSYGYILSSTPIFLSLFPPSDSICVKSGASINNVIRCQQEGSVP